MLTETHPRARDSEALQRTAAAGRGWLGTASVAFLLTLTVVWFALLRRFDAGDVYAVMGPYACAVSILVLMLERRSLRAWFAPRRTLLALGLGVGAAMTALTYPVFRLAAHLFPGLDAQVASLYAAAHNVPLAQAFTWVVAIILAEELLFRGALPAALARFLPHQSALALSLVTYALAQYGSGSWIVALMAAVCGCIWTVQRALTNSLLPGLLAHLIWTPTVILFFPVT